MFSVPVIYLAIMGAFLAVVGGGYAYVKVLEWRIKRQEAVNQALMREYQRIRLERDIQIDAELKREKVRNEARQDLASLENKIAKKDYSALDRAD